MTGIGVLAAVLTTACWLPQVLRSWRTRSTADISWAYLVTLALGISLWLVYGLLSRDVPIVLANAATEAALATLAVLKVQHSRLAAIPHHVAGGHPTMTLNNDAQQ